MGDMDGQQPERGPEDGAVEISLVGDNKISIAVTQAGVREVIIPSEFNAFRLVGMLAMILGIKLSAKVAKSIKL